MGKTGAASMSGWRDREKEGRQSWMEDGKQGGREGSEFGSMSVNTPHLPGCCS